jgi:hypothetical protein
MADVVIGEWVLSEGERVRIDAFADRSSKPEQGREDIDHYRHSLK